MSTLVVSRFIGTGSSSRRVSESQGSDDSAAAWA